MNPRLSLNARVEWFRDDDGVRVAGPGNIPGVRAFAGRDFAGDFWELTLGTILRPCPNVMVRPELRWDWFDGPGGLTGLPFDEGGSDSQFLFAADAILLF